MLVEKSVKKDELLGTQKLVDAAPAEGTSADGAEAIPGEDAVAAEETAVDEAAQSGEAGISQSEEDDIDAAIEKALQAEEDFEEEMIVEESESESSDERGEDR